MKKILKITTVLSLIVIVLCTTLLVLNNKTSYALEDTETTFTIKKVDQYGNPVEGAEFEVYESAYISHADPVKMTTKPLARSMLNYISGSESVKNPTWQIIGDDSLIIANFVPSVSFQTYNGDVIMIVSEHPKDKNNNDIFFSKVTDFDDYVEKLSMVSMNNSIFKLYNIDKIARQLNKYDRYDPGIDYIGSEPSEYEKIIRMSYACLFNLQWGTDEEMAEICNLLEEVGKIYEGKLDWSTDDLIEEIGADTGNNDLEKANIYKDEYYGTYTTNKNGIANLESISIIDQLKSQEYSNKEIIEILNDDIKNYLGEKVLDIKIVETKVPEGYTSDQTEYTANILDGEITIVNNKIEDSNDNTPPVEESTPEIKPVEEKKEVKEDKKTNKTEPVKTGVISNLETYILFIGLITFVISIIVNANVLVKDKK